MTTIVIKNDEEEKKKEKTRGLKNVMVLQFTHI